MKDNLRMFIVSKLSIGIRVEGGGQGGLQPPPPPAMEITSFFAQNTHDLGNDT